MPESLKTIEPQPQLPPSALLSAKLAALRRKQVAVAALTGVSIAVATGVELLALALFFDWWLELAWGARFVLLAAQCALLACILIRYTVAPLIRQPDDDELALMVEKGRRPSPRSTRWRRSRSNWNSRPRVARVRCSGFRTRTRRT